jgi:hypothetical protein
VGRPRFLCRRAINSLRIPGLDHQSVAIGRDGMGETFRISPLSEAHASIVTASRQTRRKQALVPWLPVGRPPWARDPAREEIANSLQRTVRGPGVSLAYTTHVKSRHVESIERITTPTRILRAESQYKQSTERRSERAKPPDKKEY